MNDKDNLLVPIALLAAAGAVYLFTQGNKRIGRAIQISSVTVASLGSGIQVNVYNQGLVDNQVITVVYDGDLNTGINVPPGKSNPFIYSTNFANEVTKGVHRISLIDVVGNISNTFPFTI